MIYKKDETLENLPGSFYSFKQHFLNKINIYYGFKCSDCSTNILIKKNDNNNYNCNECSSLVDFKEILESKEYYYHIDLKHQIKLLLEKYQLENVKLNDDVIESYYDSQVYKDLTKLKSNSKLVLLQLNTDGVEITQSTSVLNELTNSPKNEIWPIFIKILNLNCKDEIKTFQTSSSFNQSSYPNTNEYLKFIVEQLNDLFMNGLEVKGELVYPVLFSVVLDTPARNLVMNNISHNGFFGCCLCLTRGRNLNRVQIFEPCECLLRKREEEYDEALIEIAGGQESFLGKFSPHFFLFNILIYFQ